MALKKAEKYGSWSSSITAESIARGSVGLGEPALSAGTVWWLEGRPTEGGRQVVLSRAGDAIPEGFSARTRVHEYGGGAYTVAGETVFFSNDDDGRVYRVDPGAEPRPITPEPPKPRALRYADFDVTPDAGRVHCVRESHVGDGEAVNEIVAIAADGNAEPQVVATGHDFYGAPRMSPDGSRL